MKWIFLSDWPKTYQEFPLYSLHSQECFWSIVALQDLRGQNVLTVRREGNRDEEDGIQICSRSVCIGLRFSERTHLLSSGNENLFSWKWACSSIKANEMLLLEARSWSSVTDLHFNIMFWSFFHMNFISAFL